jgi:signal transduction histidine kinase
LAGNFDCDHRALELAIANQIVDAHGGRIFLENSTRNTTFVVDLPYVGRA